MKNSDEYFYVSHEKAFSMDIKGQDILWKIVVPSSERVFALRELDSMNINAFSLFGSEESLMAAVALREFYLKP